MHAAAAQVRGAARTVSGSGGAAIATGGPAADGTGGAACATVAVAEAAGGGVLGRVCTSAAGAKVWAADSGRWEDGWTILLASWDAAGGAGSTGANKGRGRAGKLVQPCRERLRSALTSSLICASSRARLSARSISLSRACLRSAARASASSAARIVEAENGSVSESVACFDEVGDGPVRADVVDGSGAMEVSSDASGAGGGSSARRRSRRLPPPPGEDSTERFAATEGVAVAGWDATSETGGAGDAASSTGIGRPASGAAPDGPPATSHEARARMTRVRPAPVLPPPGREIVAAGVPEQEARAIARVERREMRFCRFRLAPLKRARRPRGRRPVPRPPGGREQTAPSLQTAPRNERFRPGGRDGGAKSDVRALLTHHGRTSRATGVPSARWKEVCSKGG